MLVRKMRYSTESSSPIVRLLTKAITFFVAITIGIILIAMIRKKDNKEGSKKFIKHRDTGNLPNYRELISYRNNKGLSALLKRTDSPYVPYVPYVTETHPIRSLTTPLCLNNYTANASVIAVTGLPNGNLLNVYRVDALDTSSIYGRFSTENGTAIGNEFLIPSNTTAGTISVQTLASGASFLLYFADSPYSSFLHGEIVSDTGNVVREPFIIATSTAMPDDPSKKAAIAAFTNEDSLVAWHKKSAVTSLIKGQFFGADYLKQGVEFTVAESYSWLTSPHIITLPNGNYLIYYGIYGASSFSVDAKFYGADRLIIKSFTFSDTPDEVMFDVTALLDSGFIFVRSTIPTAAQQYPIYAQGYDASATVTIPSFSVDDVSYCGLQGLLSTTISNGNFLIIWSPTEPQYNNVMYAQYFLSDGTRIFNKTTFSPATSNLKNSLVTASVSQNRFAVGWSEQNDEVSAQPTVWDQFFIADNVAPVIQKNTLTINGKSSRTKITVNDIFIFDPNGSADAITIESTSTHGYLENCYSGNATTEFPQSVITQGNLYFVHDGTNYAPTISFMGTDTDGFSVGPQATTINFINPNNPPQVVHPISTIPGEVGKETVVNVTNTFSYDGTFVLSLSRADGKELDSWMKLICYVATGQSEIRFTPAPDANTATYYLAATETDRVYDQNETSHTAFQLSMVPASTEGTSNNKQILWPVIMTPIGLFGTFVLCSSSLLCSIIFGNLCFIARQRYSSQKAKGAARRDDYFAYQVFKKIGAPYDCADFKGNKGRLFRDLVRSIVEKAELQLPKETETRKIKLFAQRVGNVINTILRKHSYHWFLRYIIDFHFSLLLCGLIYPGSTPAYLAKYEDEIVAELRSKYSRELSESLITRGNSMTGITARLLEGSIDGDMRALTLVDGSNPTDTEINTGGANLLGTTRPIFFIQVQSPEALKQVIGESSEKIRYMSLSEDVESNAGLKEQVSGEPPEEIKYMSLPDDLQSNAGSKILELTGL